MPHRIATRSSPARMALQAGDRVEVDAPAESLRPRIAVKVTIVRANGQREDVPATAAVETRFEVELLQDGGVLPHILRQAAWS